MSTSRLAGRVRSARAVAVALLHGHKLKFHKKGKDGSGKCDAEYTNDARDVVYGVVFEMSRLEKPILDSKEGLHRGYREKKVSLVTQAGETMEAMTYYATSIEPVLRPFEWYREHVLRGAREHGLPAEYIAAIEAVEALPDPDKGRHERELAIYR